MSPEHSPELAARVRRLAETFVSTDLIRLRIEREGESIELGRRSAVPAGAPEPPEDLERQLDERAAVLESIKSDLVGIFRFSRPLPAPGDLLEADRELAYVEALGIRNPVRSRGTGRIVTVLRGDGDPVEYGQVLFEIDRG